MENGTAEFFKGKWHSYEDLLLSLQSCDLLIFWSPRDHQSSKFLKGHVQKIQLFLKQIENINLTSLPKVILITS